MPRNPIRPLVGNEIVVAKEILSLIGEGMHAMEITYTKRDGTSGTVAGKVLAVTGQADMSNSALLIDDETKGPRTINTYLIDTLTLDPAEHCSDCAHGYGCDIDHPGNVRHGNVPDFPYDR